MTAAAACIEMEGAFPFANGDLPRGADAAIVSRCHAGEASAFQELYYQHRSTVYRIVSRMICNDADRDEVTQDVFLQVFRSLGNYRGNAKLSTWIHRIAINVVLQHIRRKRSRVQLRLESDLSANSALATLTSTERDPESEAVQKERLSAIGRALGKLAPKKRAALVLHDFEGLPAKEVAAVVGAPVLTVRTRLFYARREFYAELSREPVFADLPLASGVIG